MRKSEARDSRKRNDVQVNHVKLAFKRRVGKGAVGSKAGVVHQKGNFKAAFLFVYGALRFKKRVKCRNARAASQVDLKGAGKRQRRVFAPGLVLSLFDFL